MIITELPMLPRKCSEDKSSAYVSQIYFVPFRSSVIISFLSFMKYATLAALQMLNCELYLHFFHRARDCCAISLLVVADLVNLNCVNKESVLFSSSAVNVGFD